MKKYILVEWPGSQELMDKPWFNQCILSSEGSANYFVPEDLYGTLAEEEITYNSLLPTFIYNKDHNESTAAYREFVEWLTQTLHKSILIDESYEEIEARVIQHIIPVGVVKSTLYNEWHKVHIKPGDVVQIDIYNNVMIVNGVHYKHN